MKHLITCALITIIIVGLVASECQQSCDDCGESLECQDSCAQEVCCTTCNQCVNRCSSQCTNSRCRNNCSRACSNTCRTNNNNNNNNCQTRKCSSCVADCSNNCGSSRCVDNCSNKCDDCKERDTKTTPRTITIVEEKTPNIIVNSTSNNLVNLTTHINLHNVITNINNISTPVFVNTTNINNINLIGTTDGNREIVIRPGNSTVIDPRIYLNVTIPTPGPGPIPEPSSCCYIYHPKECYYVGGSIKCFIKRHRECSNLCTSPVIILTQNTYQQPNCISLQNYPYLYCGNYGQNACGGCFNCQQYGHNPQMCSLQSSCSTVCRENIPTCGPAPSPGGYCI